VTEFLIATDCNTSNLITKGYGKTKPITSNDTEAGRAKNRRVELNFVK
jgi:OOP family OmpA-OmpF porin